MIDKLTISDKIENRLGLYIFLYSRINSCNFAAAIFSGVFLDAFFDLLGLILYCKNTI